MIALHRPRGIEWIAIGAFVEFAVHRSLTLAVVYLVLASGRWLDRSNFGRGLARAVLVLASSLATVLVVNRLVGGLLPTRAVAVLILVAVLVLAWRLRATKHGVGVPVVESTRLLGGSTVFAGPTILGLAVIHAYLRSRRTLPWAMSGDSKNHLIIVRDTIQSGGLAVPGYPGLANALAGLVGGWRFDLSAESAGRLGSEIAAVAITMIGLLSVMSVLGATLVGSAVRSKDRLATVAMCIASCLPLSQLWLHSFIFEGFMPTALATSTILALAIEITRNDTCRAWRVASCLMAMVILGFTYPPLVTVAIAMLPLSMFDGSIESWIPLRNRARAAGLLVVAGLFSELVLRVPAMGSVARSNLDVYGRINPVRVWPLWLFLGVALVLTLLAGPLSWRVSSVVLSTAIAAIVLDRFLDGALGADYYVQKTRWMLIVVLFALLLAAAVSVAAERPSVFGSIGVAFVSLCVVVLSMRPVLQRFPSRPVIRAMATSWTLPTVDEAEVILGANGREPRSIFWRVSPYVLNARVIDIWVTSGIEGSRQNSKWGYEGDVMEPKSVCEFAVANIPMTVWVPSEAAAVVFRSICPNGGVSVRVIDW
jgi:hypothetical protein